MSNARTALAAAQELTARLQVMHTKTRELYLKYEETGDPKILAEYKSLLTIIQLAVESYQIGYNLGMGVGSS